MSRRKNPAAVALGRLGGKKRAENLTAEEIAAIGKKGGASRSKKLTPARRKEIAIAAVRARWAKRGK